MSSRLRESLEKLLTSEDFDAEYPAPRSVARRPQPKRLPLAEATVACGVGQLMAAQDSSGTECVVVRTNSEEVFVLTDICPHDGGLLSDGYFEQGRVVCARHGWEFDVKSGQCLTRKGVSIPCQPQKRSRI